MTSITCDCGELEVQFATTKPLFRLICCCNDYNAVPHWAAWKGGHTFYPAAQGIDKIYLENSLKVARGEEHLRWVNLLLFVAIRREFIHSRPQDCLY